MPTNSQSDFMNCPAYLDEDSGERCRLPATVEYTYFMQSSDGPLEAARIRCPLGHWFNGPIEYLTLTSGDSVPDALQRDLGCEPDIAATAS